MEKVVDYKHPKHNPHPLPQQKKKKKRKASIIAYIITLVKLNLKVKNMKEINITLKYISHRYKT